MYYIKTDPSVLNIVIRVPLHDNRLSFQLDANSYYEKRYRELVVSIERENQVVKEKKKLGIGFITFRAEADAKR